MNIAILVPIHGGAPPQFVHSLANLVAFTVSKIAADVQTSTVSLSALSVARNALLSRARQARADFALMLDCDHEFPANALVRLLEHKKPVIGINQPRRAPPHSATAVAEGAIVESVGRDGLQEVESVGLGMCLLAMGVMDDLQRHAEATGGDFWPMFKEEWPAPNVHIGEDRYFCRRLREAGIPIYIDHTLSREVGHIAETVLRFPG